MTSLKVRKNFVPCAPFVPLIKEYLLREDETHGDFVSRVNDLLIQHSISERRLYDILSGSAHQFKFDIADAMMCVMHTQTRWHFDPDFKSIYSNVRLVDAT
jgi:hypothetical protein